MAKREVSGRPATSAHEPDLDDLEAEYEDTPKARSGVPFEEAYCLTNIQRQPEEYDGPNRFCTRRTAKDSDRFCPVHAHYKHLSKTANMKHGVRALREHLLDDFDAKEQEAYRIITEEWPEYYDRVDPSSTEDFHTMAIEIVREVRADAIIQDEGLTHMSDVYHEDQVVGQEEQSHYMLSERRAIRSEIGKIKDRLGITPRHLDRMDAEEERSESLSGLRDKMNENIDVDEGSFDPDQFDDELEDEYEGE